MSSKQNRVRKLLEQGLQHHRAGNLAAAEAAYLYATEADPRNTDAMNLRGVVALATGRSPLAVTLFQKATTLQPAHPGLWGNLGNALFETGNYAESEAAYRRASRLEPQNPDFAIGMANALAAAGHADKANVILRAVVKQRPDRASAWFSLAKLAESAGDTGQALEGYQRALQADPNHGNAHLNLGVVLQSLQRLDEAEQSYRLALARGAQRETAWINLVSLLTLQGKFEESEQLAQTAISELPRSAELHRLLSAARVQQGRLDAALAPAQLAATLDTTNAKLQMALGGIQFETGFPEQGLATLENIRRAQPDDLHVSYVVGVTQLTAGHFQEGWRDFIHREVRQAKIITRPSLNAQLPADLRGKSVRLFREQGLGDELFFLRYTPLLKSLGANVAYVTNPKLLSMLTRTDSIDQLIAEPTEQEPPIDASASIIDMLVGDLPHALYRDFSSYCAELPPPLALSALPEQITAMREKLSRFGPPPYLALTWRGGTAPHEQKGNWWTLYKNIRLDAFGETFAGLPYTLLAVQRKPLPQEIAQLTAAAGTPIHDLCDVNDDLEQMLALLAIVDEYVGVSNTNMHLRAGLKRGARVLVPRPSEWRWMAYGEQSPWFPEFTVYRQGIDGTWKEALCRLRAHLLG
jgi:Flp pilus assembly protein TadD